MPETLSMKRRRRREDPALPSERERLLALLHRHGILYASETQPVLSRDGTTARWMLDSLCVSLTPEGLKLAARCLLERLRGFEGRQLATLGTTAIPLLSACVLESGGRYRGLLVRKERKAHGSRKWIEGRIDRDEPVVVVDDSVSSGTTMEACIARLEEAGLWVEGGVCLVRFGWYGGFARMLERGYRMASVYDVWDDFIYRMEDEPEKPIPNPTKIFPELRWREDKAPAGLHPAHLARLAMAAYLDDRSLPQPPARLDRTYDGDGGTYVSLRATGNVYLRHAREGFWHFPGEERGPLPRDVMLAAAKTAALLPPGEAGRSALDSGAIAVTFFSALEPCTVGELDNDRYGIVVASRVRTGRMGGALPRMPGIAGAWAQFQHARMKNAALVSFEPFDLFRHRVVKAVEPGMSWQPSGVPAPADPWYEDPARAGALARRARELALEVLGLEPAAEPLADDVLGADVDSLFVTVYLDGRLRGCMGSAVDRVDDDLRRLVRLALEDRRFAGSGDGGVERLAVTVSVLWDPLELGAFSPAEVMERVRLGQQALLVHQGQRQGLLLPFVAARHGLGPQAYALEVIDKAGITRPPYRWRRYECVTWLAEWHAGGHAGDRADRGDKPRRLAGALPLPPPPPADPEALRRKLAGLFRRYLLRHQRDDGTLYFRYLPHQDVLYEGGDLPRTAHGAWVLRRAGTVLEDGELAAAGRRLVDYLRPLVDAGEEGGAWLRREGEAESVAEVSFLLLALCAGPRSDGDRRLAEGLARALWRRVDRHGRVRTHRDERAGGEAHQDFAPGQLLLALAAACEAGLSAVDEETLRRAFRRYRHRFEVRPKSGMASWHMQAFSRWWRLSGDGAHAAFVYAIADWLLDFQEAKSGGFLGDLQPGGPGYTSALFLEGLGAAVRLAEAAAEGERARRYRRAYDRGLAFVDGLVMQESMAGLLPNPPWAIGGLRQSHLNDEVRIDFVQHGLSAVLELMPRPEAGA